MRVMLLILYSLLCGMPAYCQSQDSLSQMQRNEATMPADSEEEAGPPTDAAYLMYIKGAALYEKKHYGAATKYLTHSFKSVPTEDAARYVYYDLIAQGHDLEAANFKRQYPEYTFAIPPARKGFESVYAEGGLRINTEGTDAGNIGYGVAGTFLRLSDRARLWVAATYLQDAQADRFKQTELLTSLHYYVGKGWNAAPSLHFAYVPFTQQYTLQTGVSYYNPAPDSGGGAISYRTNAQQATHYHIDGHTSFLHFALPVSKRINALTIEVEPSLHYISGSNSLAYQYSATGITDSFSHGQYKGSKPYRDSSNGGRDTSYSYMVGQFGGALSYHFSVGKVPLLLRLAGYYLQSNSSAAAFNAYALVQASTRYWLHLTYIYKGSLPAAFNREGLYLNYDNEVAARTSATLQLFPLKRYSPYFTYQFEQNTRLADGTKLVYHSVYLTLKYSL